MYEQDEEYLDEGEDGDEISNEIWQEVGKSRCGENIMHYWVVYGYLLDLIMFLNNNLHLRPAGS